jgi:small subunit ribosomal protein S20
MPNTKSAIRRTRVNERKRLNNRATLSRVRKAEKAYNAAVAAGKKDEAAKALRDVASAYDKAAKKGVLKSGQADRKKSRLTVKLNKLA